MRYLCARNMGAVALPHTHKTNHVVAHPLSPLFTDSGHKREKGQ